MSSILKALKKLEEEKTLLEEPREINLSREILKQPAETRKMLRWLWLFGGLAALVILMLTVALLRKPVTTEVIKFRELPSPPQAQVRQLPSTVQPSGILGGLHSTPPLLSNEPQQKPVRSLPAHAEAPAIRNENIELPVKAAPALEQKKNMPVIKIVPEQPAVSTEATLTLSGIAWNKDSADRLAIINGQPTAIGATVNGVVVEEILPDRVKLSHYGRIFELMIGKSTKTE